MAATGGPYDFKLSTVGRSVAAGDDFLQNSTATNKSVIFDDSGPTSGLSTTEILLIAIGTSILITTILILGVLAVCKCQWRKKSNFSMSRYKNANGHDRISNGTGLRQSLFGSKKCIRPEIVITEATSNSEDRTSAHGSILEVYSAKSVTNIPPCTLAILEDLDENELISPAVMGNNDDFPSYKPPMNPHYTRAIINPPHSAILSNESINQDVDVLCSKQEEDKPFRLDRTRSVSSTSSDKMDRPAYTYSNQSPHGMQPYGIGDHVALFLPDEECLGPSAYAQVSQINSLIATAERQQP